MTDLTENILYQGVSVDIAFGDPTQLVTQHDTLALTVPYSTAKG